MFRPLLLCSAWVAFSACHPRATHVDMNTMSASDAITALEQETGFTWTVRFHPDTGTPAFLDGKTAPLAATVPDAARTARMFILHHPALFRIDPVEDDFSAKDTQIDEFGMIHVRLQQKKGSMPVWGGEMIAHFAADGSLRTVAGRLFSIESTGLVPVIASAEARVRSIADARSYRPDVDPTTLSSRQPELWLYPVSASDAKLAYRVETEIDDNRRPMELETFVDAKSGEVLHRTDSLATLEGTGLGALGDRQDLVVTERNGRYWLEDPTRGTPAQKTYSAASSGTMGGSEVKSADLSHWDETGIGSGAAVDAHAFVALTYDYFAHVHRRQGWEDKGKGIHATVHYGRDFDNAFFNGRELVFGDGDGLNFSPLSAALDVVAHEYSHGITANTARLGHEGESGALNEAISDIFACFVAYGRGSRRDWQVGETIYHPQGHPMPLRDIGEPYATNHPARMDQYVVTDEDQGGVHRNSTIVSHAAYLMTEGGGRIGGIGVPAAERIWYRALTRYLTSQSSFADAADATILAARDFGEGHEPAVRQAWMDVGVMMPSQK